MSEILNITLGYLPAFTWGGPVKVVQQNSIELRRRDNSVVVCASNLLDKLRHIEPNTFERILDDVRVVYLEMGLLKQWPGTAGPTWMTPAAIRRLWREVGSAEIVHVHGTRNIISLCGAYFALWRGKPLVLQPHGTLQYIVASLRLKRVYDALFMRRLVRQADVLIASTPSEKQQIVAAGGSAENVEIVPNGRAAKLFDRTQFAGKFRQQLGIPDSKKMVLFMGRINSKKGTDLLVQAWAKIAPARRADAVLVIAGPDDGQLATVEQLIQQHGLQDDVLLPGLVNGDDVQAAFVDADIFVLPCRTDTFPMALVEACEAGAPIVVSDTCEMADLLADKAATVTPVDPAAYAVAIDELLHDDALRQQYRAGCAELMATSLSIEAVVDRLESIYEGVLDGRRAAA